MAADRTVDGTNKRMTADLGVAADRHVPLLLSVSDAQVGQSPSPGPSQRVRKGSKHLCVVVLHQFFTPITSFQSKVSSIAPITVLMAFVLPCPTICSQLIPTNQVIPRSILERACGFAIFTIIKAGFLFSARGGGGIVIARLDNGCEPLSCQ